MYNIKGLSLNEKCEDQWLLSVSEQTIVWHRSQTTEVLSFLRPQTQEVPTLVCYCATLQYVIKLTISDF